MFYGITALECTACKVTFSMDFPMLQEPTEEEWKKLGGMVKGRDSFCKNCVEAMKNV